MSKSAAPLILLTAGGTGGHVYPALAVALEMRARGYRVAWMGTRKGLESRVVPANGIDLHYLPVQGVRGKSIFHKIKAGFLLAISVFRAWWKVLRLRPACVVGMGGYVAGPTGIAAWLLLKPLVIHEQNAVAGTTNRMLAPFAKYIAMGFPGAFKGRDDAVVTGNPLRAELIEQGEQSRYDYQGQRPLRLLIVGGSLGATSINDVVPGTLRRLRREGVSKIEVVHQTGEAHYEEMRGRYGDIDNDEIHVAPFIEDMASAYQWADLVLCRAGALTVSELAMAGRPSILIPLPHAIDDHQTANARALERVGGAIIMMQSELGASQLVKILRGFIDNPRQLVAMSEAAKRAATPGATAAICDTCEALSNE